MIDEIRTYAEFHRKAPTVYLYIEKALLLVGPMDRLELAKYFGVRPTTMSNWIFRMRKQGMCIRITGWKDTRGNKCPIYGFTQSEDVPEPPTNTKEKKRRWAKANRILRSIKQAKTPNKAVRLNNLFGVSFAEDSFNSDSNQPIGEDDGTQRYS